MASANLKDRGILLTNLLPDTLYAFYVKTTVKYVPGMRAQAGISDVVYTRTTFDSKSISDVIYSKKRFLVSTTVSQTEIWELYRLCLYVE